MNTIASIPHDPLGLTPLPVDNRERFLRFMLSGNNDTLLPLSQIVEVMQLAMTDILLVPDMPSSVLGVSGWQGSTLWLVDLNQLVGYAPLRQQVSTLVPPVVIVIEHDGRSVGLVVEQVSEVDLYDPAAIRKPAGLCPLSLEPYVRGYCPQKEGPGGTVLDVAAILSSPLWRSHSA